MAGIGWGTFAAVPTGLVIHEFDPTDSRPGLLSTVPFRELNLEVLSRRLFSPADKLSGFQGLRDLARAEAMPFVHEASSASYSKSGQIEAVYWPRSADPRMDAQSKACYS